MFHDHVKLNLMTTAVTLTQIDVLFTNLTSFAVYNHACYSIEILY